MCLRRLGALAPIALRIRTPEHFSRVNLLNFYQSIQLVAAMLGLSVQSEIALRLFISTVGYNYYTATEPSLTMTNLQLHPNR